MSKRVVVLGGGSGSSVLLKGLKQFPLKISAIVTVCDDGKSTGRIRSELNIPAVGDLRRVLVSLSDANLDALLNYRFKTEGELNGHTVGNLLLAASTDMNGNISRGVEYISKILNLRGKAIALTKDNVTLMARMQDNKIVEGEHNITQSNRKIKKIFYKKSPVVNKEALEAIKEADVIILSMGSIWTSVLPNLICPEITKEIDKSSAKILYVCNMMTQPGETDSFKVSDHINLLNKHLGNKKIDAVIVNNKKIVSKLRRKYETLEQKDQVVLDEKNLGKTKIIKSDLFMVEDNMIRHDSLKLAFEIYSYAVGIERK